MNFYILFLFCFQIIFCAHFQNNVTIEKTLFINNQDISIETGTLNGTININTNNEIAKKFIVNNTDNTTIIHILGLPLQSTSFKIGLNLNNELILFQAENDNRKLSENIFNQINTNFVFPYSSENNQSIAINQTSGNTFFGERSDIYNKNITFSSETFLLNSNNITSELDVINLKGTIQTDSLDTSIINLISNTTFSSQISTQKFFCSNCITENNQPMNIISNILTITEINSPITEVFTSKINTFTFPKIIEMGTSLKSFLVINNENTIGTKNTLLKINNINTDTLSALNNNETLTINIKKSFSNSDSSFPITLNTKNISLTNLNCYSIDLHGFPIELSDNLSLNTSIYFQGYNLTINDAQVQTFWSSANNLYLPKNILFTALQKTDPANKQNIVLDLNKNGIWGLAPTNSLENIEIVSDFILSKKEFLFAIEPIIGETEKKKLIPTLCKNKIANSPICSLIIDYDDEGKPLYYDNESIMAIAASQIDTIKKEILANEEKIEKLKIEFSELILK